MKKKANFLRAFALLLTLGWVSEAKSQTCDFSYVNNTNCNVQFIIFYNGAAQDEAPGTMYANTSGTFHAGLISPQPPCTAVDSIVVYDSNFTTFTQCCQGAETLTPFFCGAVDVDWWDDFQWTVDD